MTDTVYEARPRIGRILKEPAILFAALNVVLVFSSTVFSAGLVSGEDKICGPRCVRYVLGTYDIRADLGDLVEEIQRNSPHHPADLDSMEGALRRRGVYAAAFRADPRDIARLNWPGPCIIHQRSATHAEGHFVVARPDLATSGYLPVWDGLNGESWTAEEAVAQDASGAVLLVSDQQASTIAACPLRTSQLAYLRAASLMGAGVAIAYGAWYWRRPAPGVKSGTG